MAREDAKAPRLQCQLRLNTAFYFFAPLLCLREEIARNDVLRCQLRLNTVFNFLAFFVPLLSLREKDSREFTNGIPQPPATDLCIPLFGVLRAFAVFARRNSQEWCSPLPTATDHCLQFLGVLCLFAVFARWITAPLILLPLHHDHQLLQWLGVGDAADVLVARHFNSPE